MGAESSNVRTMAGTLMTADELLQTQIPGKQVDLGRGVLVVREPPGYQHGHLANRLAMRLTDHIDHHGLGHVLAAETGFKLQSNPDTVRAADVAFLRQERVPDPLPEGYLATAPDLVVEVLSPIEHESLDGEDVVPGFSCALRSVL